MKVGFTIGKFAPFHKGHEFLIQRGIEEMEEFYVVVYDTPQFNIDIDAKRKWIESKFPTAKLLYAFDSPKQYGLDKKSVEIQMQYLSKIIEGIPVNYFYSSEEYGRCVADYLHISHVLVDKARNEVPVSATKIRQDIEKYKGYLDREVYEDYRKCIRNNEEKVYER